MTPARTPVARLIAFCALLLAAAPFASLLAAADAAAGSLKPVYRFAATATGTYPHGAFPSAEMIETPDGSFYTTTAQGGSVATCLSVFNGCGAVVRLMGKQESVVFSFSSVSGEAPDGAAPISGLVQGPDGALYGTASAGGPLASCGHAGCFGTVFKLVPRSGGGWRFHLLHAFAGSPGTNPENTACLTPDDGATPQGRLVLAPDGFFYGTTQSGGCVYQGPPSTGGNIGDGGTIYRIKPDGSGFQVVHDFLYFAASDGAVPRAGLTLASNGQFYGTTSFGGTADSGTVYQFDSTGGVLTLIHSFSGVSPDGGSPYGALTQGTDGLLHSTTRTGTDGTDPTYYGTVFTIDPDAPFSLTSDDFASLGAAESVYSQPWAGVIQTGDGKFYGTASNGGFYSVTKSGVFATLGTFPSTLTTTSPIAEPLQASDGRIYMTVSNGGQVNAAGFTDRGAIYRYASRKLTGPRPVVSWFRPAHAAVGGSVVVAGANFVGASSVVFSGASAGSAFVVDGSGFITATVPSGAVSGPVTVTTPAGSGTSTAVFTVP